MKLALRQTRIGYRNSFAQITQQSYHHDRAACHVDLESAIKICKSSLKNGYTVLGQNFLVTLEGTKA